MLGKKAPIVLSGKPFHVALLVIGTIFLLLDAFHGNIWFDESYSVAIANHSFTEIWDTGSGDVHPVLFYWALHVLYLIFGQNILVYRIFAVAGSVALAATGLTHVRRDFGPRVGVIFTFLSLFMPYIAQMAVEIRMYSWVTCTVMLCALYGYRIVAALSNTVPVRIAKNMEGLRLWAGAPRRWWIAFAVMSLASSYLQYYGTMSAFMVNLLILLFLLKHPVKHGRAILVFFILAAIQIALYLPWLYVAVFSQVGVVSNTYWAKPTFPTTYIELITYPVVTSQISFALRGEYSLPVQILSIVVLIALLALIVVGIIAFIRSVVRNSNRQGHSGDISHSNESNLVNSRSNTNANCNVNSCGNGTDNSCSHAPRPEDPSTADASLSRLHRLMLWVRRDEVAPFLGALGVYLLVIAFAAAASFIMNSLILYYRYLFVSIGPLLLFFAACIAYVRPRWISYSILGCILCASVINVGCMIHDDYDPSNQEPITAFRESCQDTDLVISSDIGFMGVTSVLCPDIKQTYMDWQKGNWGKAYEAYDVSMESKKSWELILDNYHGKFVVTGQSQTGTVPRDIEDLQDKDNITIDEIQMFYRPYERTWFAIATMTKE